MIIELQKSEMQHNAWCDLLEALGVCYGAAANKDMYSSVFIEVKGVQLNHNIFKVKECV